MRLPFLIMRSPILLGILILPLIAAQELRTPSFFPTEGIPIPSTLAIPRQSKSAQPSSLPQPSSSTQPTQPLASANPFTPMLAPAIPMSPVLPPGVAKTASGKPIPCSPKNTKLNPTTHKLISECVSTSFCAAPPGSPANATGLGVCYPRLCRREMYPFGYGTYGGGNGRRKNATTIEVPPMCASGMFCPDNGSGCRLKVELGSKCELGRDEQCAPPPANPGVSDKDNKSVCLNTFCMPATRLLGEPCTIENTTYVSDLDRGTAGGGQFRSFVIKHNCLAPGLFCDPTPPPSDVQGATCQKAKKLGEKCRFDAECQLNNCVFNTCAQAPEKAFRLAAWHWLATVMFIVLLFASTVLVLSVIHRRQRFARNRELQEYYYEQMSLRRSILALHAGATSEKPSGNIKMDNNEDSLNEKGDVRD
ncbi:hypothetical protein GALMADRAFT_146207 [Galerina marginata CBS 339.88]|uniref:Uncharacterized protein n=1 Tax=Galerina marginata (strain CBS 339.88) TaxID=685588 RepID=A0A067SCD8_GALM3|nr:hypothetical protein GALMADRAFT_146207 [Galerina marginata CBS 339.88]